MNCLEVRRSLDSEPAHKTSAIKTHLKNCAACAEHARRIDLFEKGLADALHIDVPEGLAYRLLLAKDINAQRDNKQGRLRFYGVAASLLLTIGLVTGLYLINHPNSLEQVALRHVQDELPLLDDKKNVPLATLNNMLSRFNIRLNNDIGTINYAGICKIRNNRGGHIVLQGDTAPVTLLLMPGEYISHQESVNDSRFMGVILPIKNGSIAIISEDKNDLKPFIRKIKQSLRVIS